MIKNKQEVYKIESERVFIFTNNTEKEIVKWIKNHVLYGTIYLQATDCYQILAFPKIQPALLDLEKREMYCKTSNN